MLQRLYIHNYRCLENFEFKLGDTHSALLIGKNGSGKSTVASVMRIFQQIGRGVSRVGNLVSPTDFSMGRSEAPMRFELEVVLNERTFAYSLALELPDRFRELRLIEEQLVVDGVIAFDRTQASVSFPLKSADGAKFNIDWHIVALPVIMDQSLVSSLSEIKRWLARMIILAPIPGLMKGESTDESLEPEKSAENFANWLTGLLAQFPSSYSTINNHLSDVMPDFAEFKNQPTGKDAKSLVMTFMAGKEALELPFDALSDGEKCTFLCAVVLAANKAYGPLFTFWDEPDNFMTLAEVRHFIIGLRKGFQTKGLLIVTSHNPETIRSFAAEDTYVLQRKSHLEPTQIRKVAELPLSPEGDIVRSIIGGELDA